MTVLYNIAAAFLTNGYRIFNSVLYGVLLYALATRFILMPVVQNYYKSLKVGEALKNEVRRNLQKKQNDNLDVDEIKDLIDKGYRPFGHVLNFAAYIFFVYLLSAVLFRSAEFIVVNGNALSPLVLGLDLSRSLMDVIPQAGGNIIGIVMNAAVSAACVALHYIHQTKAELLDPIAHTAADFIILGITAICAAALPAGTAVYWILIKTLDLIQLAVYKKYYSVNFNAPVKKSANKKLEAEVKRIKRQK